MAATLKEHSVFIHDFELLVRLPFWFFVCACVCVGVVGVGGRHLRFDLLLLVRDLSLAICFATRGNQPRIYHKALYLAAIIFYAILFGLFMLCVLFLLHFLFYIYVMKALQQKLNILFGPTRSLDILHME